MKVRIEDERVVVHKDTDLNSPPIAELVSGAEIELANTLERMSVEWGEVVLSDGQRGYIPGETQVEPLEADGGSPYQGIKPFVRRSLLALSALLALYNFTIYPTLLEVGRTTYKALKLKSWGVSDQSAYYWDIRTGPYLVLSILLLAIALIAGESATMRKIRHWHPLHWGNAHSLFYLHLHALTLKRFRSILSGSTAGRRVADKLNLR